MEDETTTTPDVESDQNLIVEDTDESQDDYESDTPTLEDYHAVKAQLEKEKKEKDRLQRLFNNARKATKELTDKPNNTSAPPIEKDELILYSKGFEPEDIEIARKVAAVEGVSLMEATKSDIYSSLKAKMDAKNNSEKAQLRPSRGSSNYAPPKTFESAKTKEDHYQLWLQTQGRA